MMEDYMISMFIDDELNLDNKIDFVEKVHEDRVFKEETVDLLKQEKQLRSTVVETVPPIHCAVKSKKRAIPVFRYAGMAVVLLAAVVLVYYGMPSNKPDTMPHRFVIHQPGAYMAQIAGSFTQWQAVSMDRIGTSDYWEIIISLPKGEHRFAYIIDGEERVADPTVLGREQDDFGGENSILVL